MSSFFDYCERPILRSSMVHFLAPGTFGRSTTVLLLMYYIDIALHFTLRVFSRHFCPKWLTVIPTLMAIAAMQGCCQHIRNSLGIKYFAQGHFDMQTRTFRWQDAGSTPETQLPTLAQVHNADMKYNRAYYVALHKQEIQECERAIYDQDDTKKATKVCFPICCNCAMMRCMYKR